MTTITAGQKASMSAHDVFHDLSIEQAMRLTGDEAVVLTVCAADHGPAAQAALGQIAWRTGVALPADSPLVVWAFGGVLSAAWRAQCPPAPGSLWLELEFLTDLYAAGRSEVTGADAWQALKELRQAAAAELS